MNRFTGKVAIVTGAAQGIGEAYATALAAEDAVDWDYYRKFMSVNLDGGQVFRS